MRVKNGGLVVQKNTVSKDSHASHSHLVESGFLSSFTQPLLNGQKKRALCTSILFLLTLENSIAKQALTCPTKKYIENFNISQPSGSNHVDTPELF